MRLLLLGMLCFACAAHAGDDWTREDSYRQSALTALLVVDWAQTRYIAKHPYQCNNQGCMEEQGNARLLIGRHPTIGKINNYFAAGILANAAISYALPREWRRVWQYVHIAYEAGTVAHNRSIGIKMAF